VEAGILPLEEARGAVVERLMERARLAKGRGILAAAVEQAGAEAGLASLSDIDSMIASGATDTVTRNSYVPPLGYANEALTAAFVLPVGQVSDALELSGGVCMVKPLWRSEPDTVAADDPALAQVMQSLAANQQQQIYVDWYLNRKRNASVEEHLDDYYVE
jgi:hypothetical protein